MSGDMTIAAALDAWVYTWVFRSPDGRSVAFRRDGTWELSPPEMTHEEALGVIGSATAERHPRAPARIRNVHFNLSLPWRQRVEIAWAMLRGAAFTIRNGVCEESP